MQKRTYDDPLVERYSSPEMSFLWSPQYKFSTWRRLWYSLASCQQQLGLKNITTEQLDEMKQHLEDIDFKLAEEKERQLRHDVMAHIHTFGEKCPKARGIIHLGATSCFVGDNTDLIQMKESMKLLKVKMLHAMVALKEMAIKYKDVVCLGYTHFQPAQLTTVGKRACLWLQDFMMDFIELERCCDELPFRGVKGTTGTQASFLELFNGDHEKVRKLDRMITEMMGFKKSIGVTGQTYSRKLDFKVLSILSGITQSAHKMATDIRLLQAKHELEEPFEKNQVGSSAMAYKRNPMRSERICSLSRYVISLAENAAYTHSTQWFERTLDDSAQRRLTLPQAFLAVDGILKIVINVISGIVVWPKVIHKNVMRELPFMATENILMDAVKLGGDRQQLHEAIRKHSMEAAKRMKEEGAENDLLERISKDPAFKNVKIDKFIDPLKFIGRANRQVEEFITEEINPILKRYQDVLNKKIDSKLHV